MMTDESLQTFLDQLASRASTPGGGSAAGLMGAMGAALVSMVCNLTLGKEKHADVAPEMAAVLASAERVRQGLTVSIAADIEAFDAVMAAYGMAKATDEEKTLRSAAIQRALVKATEAPLDCARLAAEVIQLSLPVALRGNPNVVSDAGVAVMAGWASLRSAALNVYVNAGAIKDRGFAEAQLAELSALLAAAEPAVEEIYGEVRRRLQTI